MTAALKLYEAVDAIDVVRAWIYEHDEEIRAMEGALPDELAELLAQAEGDFKSKAERVALFVRELLANAGAIKVEEQRLAARRQHYEKAADGLKAYLKLQMEAADIPKVEGKLVTVRIQKNPPSVKCSLTPDDIGRLRADPGTERFVAVIPESYRIDAKAVLEGWKSGEVIPAGFTVEQGSHLRIV